MDIYIMNSTSSAISSLAMSYPLVFLLYALAFGTLIISLLKFRKSLVYYLITGSATIITAKFFHWLIDWASVQAITYGHWDLAEWLGYGIAAIVIGWFINRFLAKKLLKFFDFKDKRWMKQQTIG